jgi:mRNA-degrading endonuclease RelE of RelBE toxin-antitoxin system
VNGYSVEVKPPTRKELEALADNVLSRVVRRLEALAYNPRPTACRK